MIVDKADYLDKVENVLNDTCQIKKNNLKIKGILSFPVNQEKCVDNVFKKLVSNIISAGSFLKQLGLGQIYGLSKVHKDIIDNYPPFRNILSAINTPTYKLSKFLGPILKSLTSNGYTVKDSFTFDEKIVEQDSEFFIGSLDVDSLFTNIPPEETFEIN